MEYLEKSQSSRIDSLERRVKGIEGDMKQLRAALIVSETQY